jgi:hypothetical protein
MSRLRNAVAPALGLFLLMSLMSALPIGLASVSTAPEQGIVWSALDEGLDMTELPGPFVSAWSDSKVTVVRINPSFYSFGFTCSTQYDTVQRTVREWCEMAGWMGGINAGMYSLKDHRSGMGYLKNFEHLNNPVFRENYNALALFEPKEKNSPAFRIIDMDSNNAKSMADQYQCCLQSIRMIDGNGQAVYWKKKPILRCSMSVLAIDQEGRMLWLFTRSPYTANEFIDFMLAAPLGIRTAMYLEGGPEATLFLKTATTEIEKFGSYVSYSNPDDENAEVRKMPNILGFKKK